VPEDGHGALRKDSRLLLRKRIAVKNNPCGIRRSAVQFVPLNGEELRHPKLCSNEM
jgi:hypothetical protein